MKGPTKERSHLFAPSVTRHLQRVAHWRSLKGPTQERSHACSNCDKTFKESEYLKKHERTHTRDKPFACSKCKKAFNYNEVLKGHEVTHKGEKLFAFTKFAKKFKNSGHLKKHERTHKWRNHLHVLCVTRHLKSFGRVASFHVTSDSSSFCTLLGKQIIYHLCGSLGAILEELNNFMPFQILATSDSSSYCTLMGKQMIYHLCGSLGAVLEEFNNFLPLQILPPTALFWANTWFMLAFCSKAFSHSFKCQITLNVLSHLKQVFGFFPMCVLSCTCKYTLKRFVALGTGKWLLSCVHPFMSLWNKSVIERHVKLATC